MPEITEPRPDRASVMPFASMEAVLDALEVLNTEPPNPGDVADRMPRATLVCRWRGWVTPPPGGDRGRTQITGSGWCMLRRERTVHPARGWETDANIVRGSLGRRVRITRTEGGFTVSERSSGRMIKSAPDAPDGERFTPSRDPDHAHEALMEAAAHAGTMPLREIVDAGLVRWTLHLGTITCRGLPFRDEVAAKTSCLAAFATARRAAGK